MASSSPPFTPSGIIVNPEEIDCALKPILLMTIKKPIITGGAPANEFAFKKHERMMSEKLANPFKTNELSREKTILLETANLGPGLYSPEKGEIGGSSLEITMLMIPAVAPTGLFTSLWKRLS